MSIVFSDTSTYKGLIQLIEKEIGANLADISGSTTKLKETTADINLAMDDYLDLALKSSGTWQFDDSNQTDHPIITTALVDGQRDYAFTLDGSNNLILEVMRVFVKPSSTATTYIEIFPKDQQSETGTEGFTDGASTEGTPWCYDKTGNGIFLDPIPSYNVSAGLKVYISREPSYFAYTDTTKKAGVPGLHHRYFVLRAAEDYCRRNLKLSNYSTLRAERLEMEKEIEAYYGRRERDVRHIIRPKPINFR